jgi:hypothetical protein
MWRRRSRTLGTGFFLDEGFPVYFDLILLLSLSCKPAWCAPFLNQSR